MPIEPATVLDGRYTLEEVIGRGGMADVYRATDQVLGREVAVKLLRDLTASESERARFTAEARTLARLSHTGLVTVLDAGTSADQPYLVMELVDGSSLAEACAGQALHPQQVALIGAQLAETLAYAHGAGVVHRDVKPGNVLLEDGGPVRLTDFGIARLIGDTARHTKTGFTIGSPAYLAPEQVRGDNVTAAADVYSLGLVLLEALTGQRVYTGSPTEAALARLTVPPSIPPQLPAGWQELLAAMTALEAEDRPLAREVAARLRELSAGDEPTEVVTTRQPDDGATRVLTAPVPAPGSSAGASTSVPDTLRRLADRVPARWLRWAGSALAGLVLLVAVVLLWPGGGTGGGDTGVPDGVPQRLEEPLGDLHDAVYGGGQ